MRELTQSKKKVITLEENERLRMFIKHDIKWQTCDE